MRPKVVAGNWKMNKTLDEAIHLIDAVLKGAEGSDKVQKIFFPPYPFLNYAGKLIKDKTNFFAGAQNCSEHHAGAYTGEVSAQMLYSVGCSFVLVGHSERRQYYGETNLLCAQKVKQALENNLRVIYCVGEKLEERKNNSHFDVVKIQLKEALAGFSPAQLENTYLAYEPVWAIGTGETASSQQAQEMHAFIRTTISELFGKGAAEKMPILYGGSCNAQNAKELFACKDVDGGLIGGASLKAEDFCKIISSF
jgi:triosephosphate isomerase (TIM)